MNMADPARSKYLTGLGHLLLGQSKSGQTQSRGIFKTGLVEGAKELFPPSHS